MNALASGPFYYKALSHLCRRFSPVTLLDRWAFTILAAVGVGVLFSWVSYKFTPSTSVASTDVFIASRLNPSASLKTEMLILVSETAIEQALSDTELGQQKQFANMSGELARDWIVERVKVEQVADDIVRVSASSNSDSLSTMIVEKIVDQYRESVVTRAGAASGENTTDFHNLPEVLASNMTSAKASWFHQVTLGAMWGFLVALGFVGIYEITDFRFRNPEEIAEHFEVPIAGHIPLFQRGLSDQGEDSLVAIRQARGRANESYRSVRTWLSFQEGFRDKQVLQITSPLPGDGKSTLAANLAINLARTGRRVLLMDNDLRRPQIRRLFHIESEVGVETLLTGYSTLTETIAHTSTKGLFVLPVVRRPGNPSELLGSDAYRQLLDELRQSFDFVIIDTPPLLACCDASAVAGVADGVLVSMQLTRRTRHHAARAFELLNSVNANVLGIVVNGHTPNFNNGYSYWQVSYTHSRRPGTRYVSANTMVEDQTTSTADT